MNVGAIVQNPVNVGAIIQNPTLAQLFIPTIATALVSKKEAFKQLPVEKRTEVLDLVATTTQQLFRQDRAPLLPREQLLFTAKISRIAAILPAVGDVFAPFTQKINEVEARKNKSLEEQIAFEKEQTLQKLTPDCKPELREKIEALCQKIVEKRFASGYDEQLLLLKRPLLEGTLKERLDALHVLAELQLARKDYLEDGVEGPPALEFLIEQACGRETALDTLLTQARASYGFFNRLIAFLKPEEAAPASASASASTSAVPYAPFAPMLLLAARIDAVRVAPLPVPTAPAPIAFLTDFRVPFQEATPLPEAIADLVGEYHYSVNELLPAIDCDLTRLPPNWSGRLRSESANDQFTANLSNSNLTYQKLARIAAEWQPGRAAQLFVGGSTLDGKSTVARSAFTHFFTTPPNVTRATCYVQESTLQQLMPYREDLGLTEEQLWNLEVTLHDDEHRVHPNLHSVQHLEWRANEHAKLLAILQKLFRVFIPG